jgi:hypothetical protein
VDPSVPPVEVADDADAIGVRRPHGEMNPDGCAHADAMSAELLERAQLRALAEEMQIEIGQHAAVPIGIVDVENVIG